MTREKGPKNTDGGRTVVEFPQQSPVQTAAVLTSTVTAFGTYTLQDPIGTAEGPAPLGASSET